MTNITESDIDFTQGKRYVSSASKYVIKVPEMKGEALVDPDGKPILDYKGDKIGDEGVLFHNRTDNSLQAVPTDGKNVIIINQVSTSDIAALDEMMGNNPIKSWQDVNKILDFAQNDRGLGDCYNSQNSFIEQKMSNTDGSLIHGAWESGGFKRDEGSEVLAVKIEGNGSFDGPAAGAQQFEDGAFIVKEEGSPARLVQAGVFEDTYRSFRFPKETYQIPKPPTISPKSSLPVSLNVQGTCPAALPMPNEAFSQLHKDEEDGVAKHAFNLNAIPREDSDEELGIQHNGMGN